MSDGVKLTQTRIRAGVWEGMLGGAGATAPKLEVMHLEKPVPGVSVTAVPGREGDYAVRVPIPAELLSEGVQTFLIRSGAETLAHFTIITGVAMEDDLRAEIDLLRAELDMLKRAFRRHCLETAGQAG
ncbi:hypothetical protein LHP98_15450 [Rhodobacter sp. Har01]|uniref:hypothetical protein n=1 Tax=Rhodobacter sp. Har01 TaxID=2883999 RepID=UPI001D090D75|nr:hypothetical protein [Rhodobacter sp. Har01]MCB6179518.1 hypothetical protein [Rhodobacter sp. Har01]